MLEPVYRLLFGRFCLALSQDQVKIRYKVYKANDLGHMQTITDQKLAPGETACFYITDKL